jgi:predicted GIY-YIG superfamily endonuclease
MNEQFRQYVESLPPLLERLLACEPFKFCALPKGMLGGGVYLFSEGEQHLYAGRTNGIRKRLQQHCRLGSGHNSAAFAFILACEIHGRKKATYKQEGSRKQLAQDPQFSRAFTEAKERLRVMDIRFVEEPHSLRQALLEMYVAVALRTKYNSFDNH